jgi:hypothetical protein
MISAFLFGQENPASGQNRFTLSAVVTKFNK